MQHLKALLLVLSVLLVIVVLLLSVIQLFVQKELMLVWVMEFVALVLLELTVPLIDLNALLVRLVTNVAIPAKERNLARLVTILSKEIILRALLVPQVPIVPRPPIRLSLVLLEHIPVIVQLLVQGAQLDSNV